MLRGRTSRTASAANPEGGELLKAAGWRPAPAHGSARIVKTDLTPSEYQVWAADKTGTRMLAAGPDIAPGSLALAGGTLYWTQAGKSMSAPLN